LIATSLLAEVAQIGIKLWVEGDAIRYAPKTAMRPDLSARLKAHRDEVLHLLKPSPVTCDQIRLWLHCLREAGCRIRLVDDEPVIEWAPKMGTPDRRREWAENLDAIALLLQETTRAVRPMQPRPIGSPPDSILADPIILCPQCSCRPVLRELRKLTGGLCYSCWERGQGGWS
jgi:hypothetical protein